MKFVAFKPPVTLPMGTTVPRRFYFTFSLFTFQPVKTEICELKVDERMTTPDGSLMPGQQYLLEKHMARDTKITRDLSSLLEAKFSIDSSVSKIKDENIEFAQYLMERELSVNVYDADSMIQYGTFRSPLLEMLRQGRSSLSRAKECEIASFDASDRSITGAVSVGAIQLLVINSGKRESVQDVKYDEDVPANIFEGEQKDSGPSPSKSKFKKKVKSKPVDMLDEGALLGTKTTIANETGLGI